MGYNSAMNARLLFIFVVLVFAFVSCDSKNPVQEYGDTVIKGYKSSQKVGSRASVKNLQDSISGFQAANGRYPNDLKELESFTGVSLDESKYDYNPSTGIITAKE